MMHWVSTLLIISCLLLVANSKYADHSKSHFHKKQDVPVAIAEEDAENMERAEHEEGSRRQLSVLTHHPHHYMIDPLPVHYGQQHSHGFAVLGNQGHSLVGEGYSVLAGHGHYAGMAPVEGGSGIDAGYGIGGMGGVGATHMYPHHRHHHHHHSLGSMFPLYDNGHEGLNVAATQEDGDVALNGLASNLDNNYYMFDHGHGHGYGGYGLGHGHGYGLGHGHGHGHGHGYGHGYGNYGGQGLEEEYGEGLLTPIDHDDPVEGIVDDMTHGQDISHVHGHDHVHVSGNDHGQAYGGWASQPYVYGANYNPGGWGDGHHGHRHHGHHIEEVPVHAHHNHHYHAPFHFHYPTYEIPVHGSIVSETEAQKIGLYDDKYLKKLGIWEESKGGGLLSNERANWVGGGGPLDKLVWQRHFTNGANSTLVQLKNSTAQAQGGNGGVIGNNGNGGGSGGGCQVPADVGFLFDASMLASKGDKKKEYFRNYIEFAKRVVGIHKPSQQGFHYGAVIYGEDGELQFDFEKSYDEATINNELEKIKSKYPKGESKNIAKGLTTVKHKLFEKTSRDWANQVLIILTDTKGDGDYQTAAKELRDMSVNIFVIGISDSGNDIDLDQMNNIATDVDKYHAFKVLSKNLLGTRDQVDHPQDLAAVIPDLICRMNLVFVINMKNHADSEIMRGIKDFILESTRSLGFGETGSHVAVAGYAGKSGGDKIGWNLLEKREEGKFQAAVANLETEAGATNDASRALETALSYYIKEKNEPRENNFWRYINVTVVISDEALSGGYIPAAQKLRDHGIIVHSVGWGANANAGKETYIKVASDSDDFYVHVHQDISKLTQVAKRMRQYFAHLLNGREGENKKINSWDEHFTGGASSSSSSFQTQSSSQSYSSSQSSTSSSKQSPSRSNVNTDDVDMDDSGFTSDMDVDEDKMNIQKNATKNNSVEEDTKLANNTSKETPEKNAEKSLEPDTKVGNSTQMGIVNASKETPEKHAETSFELGTKEGNSTEVGIVRSPGKATDGIEKDLHFIEEDVKPVVRYDSKEKAVKKFITKHRSGDKKSKTHIGKSTIHFKIISEESQ